MFLALLHEEPGGPLMQALAAYDWDEGATQPELRAWFTDMAIFFRLAAGQQQPARGSATHLRSVRRHPSAPYPNLLLLLV
jgi:hypothetical protein